MRCSICLEEMDHPATSTFSCPRKNETWHTREYRQAMKHLDELGYQLRGKPTDRDSLEAQAQKAIEHLLELRGELRACEYPECWTVFKPEQYGQDYYYCKDHENMGRMA